MDLLFTIVVTFWIILILVYLISAFYFFILGRNSTLEKERRRVLLIVCFIFLFIALSRLIHVIVVFRHGGLFKTELSIENDLIFAISPMLFYSGIIAIIYSFEKILKKFNRSYFTFLLIIIAIIHFSLVYIIIFNKDDQSLTLLSNIVSYSLNFVAGVLGMLLALMYLKISIKTSGEVMKKALLIFIGFILLITSYALFGLEDFGASREILGLLTSIFGIAAVPFLIFGYK